MSIFNRRISLNTGAQKLGGLYHNLKKKLGDKMNEHKSAKCERQAHLIFAVKHNV
jgi:hypothetical protein